MKSARKWTGAWDAGDRSARFWEYALSPERFCHEQLGFTPDVVQERLLRGGSHRVLLNCSRQWGKSTVTAAKALHRAYCAPGALVVVVSRNKRQSAEFLRKVKAFVRRLGIRPRGDGDNELSVLLPNGSRVVGLPAMEENIRGFSAVSLLILDEAARIPDAVYYAVRPMLAVGNGDLWLLSTPRGRKGFFFEEWAQGEEAWTRIAVKVTECPRVPAAFVEQERARNPWFQQEYMCEFRETKDSLFSGELLDKAFDCEEPPLRIPKGWA